MDPLFRVFVLKECHGWHHETALVEYLACRPVLCEQLDLVTVPDQSTLWRSWRERFSAELRSTTETAARTILITAQNAGVQIPRDPERKLDYRNSDDEDSTLEERRILERVEPITDRVSRIVLPAFSLNRSEGCEIHENAFWGLRTYLGL
jgi:hypothetical protein